MRLSIIIPVYNEAATVGALVDRVRELEIDKELIIVNDGSSDGSREALRRFEGEPGITVHHSPVNLGKGASVRIGFSLAKGDIVKTGERIGLTGDAGIATGTELHFEIRKDGRDVDPASKLPGRGAR